MSADAMLPDPEASSRAPAGSAPLAQPWSALPALPQGQAVPEPSPEQNDVAERVLSVQMSR